MMLCYTHLRRTHSDIITYARFILGFWAKRTKNNYKFRFSFFFHSSSCSLFQPTSKLRYLLSDAVLPPAAERGFACHVFFPELAISSFSCVAGKMAEQMRLVSWHFSFVASNSTSSVLFCSSRDYLFPILLAFLSCLNKWAYNLLCEIVECNENVKRQVNEEKCSQDCTKSSFSLSFLRRFLTETNCLLLSTPLEPFHVKQQSPPLLTSPRRSEQKHEAPTCDSWDLELSMESLRCSAKG